MNAAVKAIATSLGIAAKQIKSIEEWASVYFVRFYKGSPQFVSKKVVGIMPVLHWAGESFSTHLKAQNFYGFSIHSIRAKGKKQNVLGLFASHEIKGAVKSFCNEKGGSWDEYAQCYYVPLSNARDAAKLILEAMNNLDMEYAQVTVDSEYGKVLTEAFEKWVDKYARV